MLLLSSRIADSAAKVPCSGLFIRVERCGRIGAVSRSGAPLDGRCASCAMFTLIYGLYEYIFKREEYHILVLGLDKAGKTNVLERLKTLFAQQVIGLDPGKILPTVGKWRRVGDRRVRCMRAPCAMRHAPCAAS